MHVDVITIFPEMFPRVLGASILKRAQEAGRLRVSVHNLRDYTHDKRRTVDDRPFGGGPGMIMKPEPLFEAVEAVRRSCGACTPTSNGGASRARVPRARTSTGPVGGCQTILLSPQGERLTSRLAQRLASAEHLILICGHYEGVDERIRYSLVDQSVSIGDYVLTGGELPAMVLVDCLARFIPGVIGHEQATREESFAEGWLEYPQYTRPAVFRDMAVPKVLRSGDHTRIARWRKLQSVARTLSVRPDLAAGRQQVGRVSAAAARRRTKPVTHAERRRCRKD